MITADNQLMELLDSSINNSDLDSPDRQALLIQAVNYLLERDFGRLCQILYRVDVDEKLLKETLKGSEEPPAKIIARLLLERQKQKLVLRAHHRGNASDIAEEDRW